MPKAAAILIGLGAAIGLALPAAAGPYLMLSADDRGFQALDLGGIDRSQVGQVQATLIEAPLAGVQAGSQLAPLIERRVEIDCTEPRWRVTSIAFLDGQGQALANDDPDRGDGDQGWAYFIDDDDLAPAIQAAACRREYRGQLVSRYLNLREILANYQAAHAKPAREPQTEKELLDRKFRNSH